MKKVEEIREGVKVEAQRLNLHFNQVLTMVAYERAIARLMSVDELRESIVFKGGMLMRVAYGSPRFTLDLDMSFEGMSQENLQDSVLDAMKMDYEDGFSFDLKGWKKITEQKDYSGIRLQTDFSFQGKYIQAMQMDFTVSEIKKSFVKKNLSLSLEGEKLACNVYSAEQILAEKIEALVSRGEKSTRSKDIFDINHLMSKSINKDKLSRLTDKIFKVRGTDKPKSFKEFFQDLDKERLKSSWQKYQNFTPVKMSFEDLYEEFEQNMTQVDSYLYRGLSR